MQACSHAPLSAKPSRVLQPRRSRQAASRVGLCRAQRKVDDWAGQCFTLLSTCPAATEHLAGALAAGRQLGDALCLKGDAGAGKSTFSRAYIRAAAGDAGLEVHQPSPSLVPGIYSGGQLQHFDLKGLSQPAAGEAAELAAAFAAAVSLIESAEQLRDWGAAPEQRLALYFRRLPTSPEADARLISVVPHTGAWEARVELLHAELAREGPPAGLVVLSQAMAQEMLQGLPEAELALVSA